MLGSMSDALVRYEERDGEDDNQPGGKTQVIEI